MCSMHTVVCTNTYYCVCQSEENCNFGARSQAETDAHRPNLNGANRIDRKPGKNKTVSRFTRACMSVMASFVAHHRLFHPKFRFRRLELTASALIVMAALSKIR